MSRKVKNVDVNMFYQNQGQANEKLEKRKIKEREKRIKKNKEKTEVDFDKETEELIQMTNRNRIKKEESQKKVLTRKEKKRRKKIKKIKFILKIILFFALVIGLIIFAMVSPIFNIKDIQVVNNNQVAGDTIISLSELKKDENIFRFNSKEIIEKVKQNAYIENAKIHRMLPGIVQIEVEEREHSYNVDFLGKYAYINTQGYILEISEDSKQKIVLQGIKTPEEQVIVGNRLNEEDLNKLEDVIKIMSVAKEYNLDTKITSIDINNKNEYSIYLEEEKKKAHLGDSSNLSNKMLYVNAIIEKERGKAGDIFVNGDLNDKFKIYFRESLNI